MPYLGICSGYFFRRYSNGGHSQQSSFSWLAFLTTCSPTVENGDQHGICCQWRAPILYNIVLKVLVHIEYNATFMYVCGQQQNRWWQKCRQIAGDFIHHADVVLRCGAHHPMEHLPSFARSHKMPPLGKCLHRIAAAAAMVNNFVVKHKTLTKTYLSS